METVAITTEYITLGQFLKYINVASGGGDIKAILASESVRVDGALETRRGKKLRKGNTITIDDVGTYVIG